MRLSKAEARTDRIRKDSTSKWWARVDSHSKATLEDPQASLATLLRVIEDQNFELAVVESKQQLSSTVSRSSV